MDKFRLYYPTNNPISSPSTFAMAKVSYWLLLLAILSSVLFEFALSVCYTFFLLFWEAQISIVEYEYLVFILFLLTFSE